MSRRCSKRLKLWLALLVSTAASLAAKAQVADIDPRWLRLDNPQENVAAGETDLMGYLIQGLDIIHPSVGMQAEGLAENETVGGVKSTHEQLYLAPTVGGEITGSIYHPNLISFDLIGEDGWGWLNDTVSGPSPGSSRHEGDNLLRYLAQVNVLQAKPYNASFTAAQDQTVRTYDTFNSYTVDSTRDNGHFGWHTSALELNADLGYRDETSTGITGATELTEDFFNFSGTQKRQNGQSSVTYRYDNFDNVIDTGLRQNSVFNSVGVSDTETFGGRRQINASTSAGYSDAQYSSQRTETITANENVTDKLGPKLDSFLMFNFSKSSLHPADSTVVQGTAGLRHQLYDSLTSVLDVHGSYDDSSSSTSSSDNDRFGVRLQENYTKRLGDWGRLTAGAGITADHEDHNASGGVLTVVDESHNLTNAPVYLNNPQVVASTIVVMAPDHTIIPEAGNYEIIPMGLLTEIRIVPGSLIYTYGGEALVNYESESLYNASFEAFNSSAQIRLELFNKFGIYGRMNKLDNNAPPVALTQTLTDLAAGMDYNWRWFRASGEYEDYDSNFTQYQAWRFLQSFNYQLSNASRFGLDFSQNLYRYSGNLNQNQYQFIARYNTQFDFSLSWYVEGGYALHDFTTTDENYGFGRTGLTWSRGKLSVRAGYEYNYQTTTTGSATEQRDRNFFFAYLKRTF